MSLLENTPGYADVLSWFGVWPSFHDAEVLELCLKRVGQSHLKVLTWESTPDVDERGHYILRKHAVVVFLLENVRDVQLEDFSSQNVIFGMHVEMTAGGVRLELQPCFGIAGKIEAEGLRLELHPVAGQTE